MTGYNVAAVVGRTEMNGLLAMAASTMLVIAFAVAGVGVAVAAPTPASPPGQDAVTGANAMAAENTSTDTNNASVTPPGAKLAGVVGVHGAEIKGEVEYRSYDRQLVRSQSNASRANVVAGETERLRNRLTQLETRRQELNASYQNGSVLTGSYHARLATITAQVTTLERLLNRTQTTASGLPSEDLKAHGIEAATIDDLRHQARQMAGPDVAAIAEEIAGPEAGHAMGPGRNGHPENGPEHPGGKPNEDGHAGPSDSGATTAPNPSPSEHGAASQNASNTSDARGTDHRSTPEKGPSDSSTGGSGSDGTTSMEDHPTANHPETHRQSGDNDKERGPTESSTKGRSA